MLITTETIDAIVRSQTAPRQQSGVGRVIRTDNATFLQTGTERIPIELPPGSNLRNGAAVRFEIAGNMLAITPVTVQKNGEQNFTADIFNRTQTVSPAAPLTATTVNGPFYAGTIPPGLYLITDIDEGAALVGRKDGDLLQQLKVRIEEDGGALLRIETAGPATSRVLLFKMSEITPALQTLRASFTSVGLTSVPVEVLQKVLLDRGQLPFTPLVELDLAMQKGGIPFTNARAGSFDAQNSALVQWFHAVLSGGKLPEQAVPLAPVSSASIVMTEFERLLPSLATISGKPIATPGEFGLTRQLIEPVAGAPDPITAAARRMGFTLEHSLSEGATGTQTVPPGSTLKGLLLNLSTQMSVQYSPAPIIMPQELPGILPDNASAPQINEVTVLAAGSKPGGADQLNDHYRQLVQAIRREAPQLYGELIIPTADNRSSALPNIAAAQQSQVESAPTSAAIPPLLVNIAVQTAELLISAGKINMQNDMSPGAIPMSGIPAQQRDIATLVKQLSEISDSLSQTVSDIRPPSQPPPVVQLVRSALDTVEALVKILGKLPETGPAAPETPGPERDRATINLPQERASLPAASSVQQSLFSRTIDATLDRLESLQLLARQTPTTQGTQQIIALPIKFGESWTEINVRFQHHRQEKTSKKRNHYSVFLDVAPAALGGITARLDYRASAPLQVRLEFERPSTRDWFTAHRDELQSSLAGGTRAVTVRFDLRPKRQQASASTNVPPNNAGTIDMTG